MAQQSPSLAGCMFALFFLHISLFIEFESVSFQEEPAMHLHNVVTQILHFSGYTTKYIREQEAQVVTSVI